MKEILVMCIPVIIGALIAIIPTAVEKAIDRKNKRDEERLLEKQNVYVELITLFAKVLKEQKEGQELDQLRKTINLVSITGSVEVVKALNEYIDCWGRADEDNQTQNYNDLLKAIRVDLGVDKRINDNFPEIGLRDITVKTNIK